MIIKKILLILTIATFLLSVFAINTLAVTYEDLPWDWFVVGSSDQNVFLGVGTRNPNLGDNIGLEFGTTYKNEKFSPELDALYFFDPTDNFSLNLGIGVYTDSNNSSAKYGIAYSGGVWFHFAHTITGIGYNTFRGVTLRCGLVF